MLLRSLFMLLQSLFMLLQSLLQQWCPEAYPSGTTA
jgi:hypothetical protein